MILQIFEKYFKIGYTIGLFLQNDFREKYFKLTWPQD